MWISRRWSWACLPTGRVLHSHHYRYATPFSNQSVVILGANASGLDISIELAKVGAQVQIKSRDWNLWGHTTTTFHSAGSSVYIKLTPLPFFKVILSHRKPRFTFPLPPEIKQSSPVTAVDEDGNIHFQVIMSLLLPACPWHFSHVVFGNFANFSFSPQDGSVATADVLMFCTGYNFSFPFLDGSQLGLNIQSHLVSPLYQYMIPPGFPSLFIIGICKIICPFPNFDCQVSRYTKTCVNLQGDGWKSSLSLSLSAGPLCSGRARRICRSTVCRTNGGRGGAAAARTVEEGDPAAPPADHGSGSVGVLPDAGAHRWLSAAAGSLS